MRQKKPQRLGLPLASLLIAVLLIAPFSQSARGQAGDTPSHRRIPLGAGQKPPTFKDFLTPEMLEMRRELSNLKRKQRRAQQQPRSPRREGETNSQRIERNRRLAEELQRNMPNTTSDEIAEQIRTMSEQLGQRLGGALADSVKPDAVPFDPENKSSFWDQASELADTIRQRERVARQQYEQAKELYETNWPKDSVAPDEWLRKVQPFVNKEVIKQIAEASEQFESQKHLPPEQRVFRDFANNTGQNSVDSPDKPSSIFDSLMKSIDKQGTDWLKSSKEKPKSSFWKSVRSGAKERLTKFNRSMTENSKQRAGAGSVFQRPSSKATASANPRNNTSSNRSGGAVPATSASEGNGTPFYALLFGLALAIGVAFYFWKKQRQTSDLPFARRLPVEAIHDCESLLAACHELAVDTFGFRSRYWNHRHLFRQFTKRVDGRKHVVDQLREIYERARYAPGQRINDSMLERARNLFSQVQRGLGGAR